MPQAVSERIFQLLRGGQVGAKIGPHLEELRAKAAQYDRFARDIDYIFPCRQQTHACALGAACFGLEEFGRRVLYREEEKL